MAHVDWEKFDHQLMSSQSVLSIKHGLEPAGFSYAAFEAGPAGPKVGAANAWGIRDPDHHPLTNHSVRECDSMSKTLTALTMMQQISRVPEVDAAYRRFAAAASGDRDARHHDWHKKVEHYLNRPIADYVPRLSGDNTNWAAMPATATIRIKDLMTHTSGLSLGTGDGPAKVVTGGDDWVAIQNDLNDWTPTRHDQAQGHIPVLYSNTNFALLRYVIAFFNLISVNGQSADDAHAAFSGDWAARDHAFGRLYRDIARAGIFDGTPPPVPDIFPYGDNVWYFSESHQTAWDITNSQPDWAVLAGAWGWKLTAHQYAHAIARVMCGKTMPAEYWKLMLGYTDNSPSGYGMAIYTVGSRHSIIGKYYSHNGGDSKDLCHGGGAWYVWDDKVLVVLQNSPCAT